MTTGRAAMLRMLAGQDTPQHQPTPVLAAIIVKPEQDSNSTQPHPHHGSGCQEPAVAHHAPFQAYTGTVSLVIGKRSLGPRIAIHVVPLPPANGSKPLPARIEEQNQDKIVQHHPEERENDDELFRDEVRA